MHRRANADIDHINLPALPLFSSHNSSIPGSSTNCDLSIAQLDSHSGRNHSQSWKKKRQQRCLNTKSQLDIKHDAVIHQHNIQQQLPSGDYGQLQSHSPALVALVQQHTLENQKQQKFLQSVPELRGVDLKKQRQQQMREYLQQLADQQVHCMHPFNGNVCSRQLTQYMYHLQHRQPDNSIAYWREFVADYYDSCAKKRWCFSLCDSATLHANSVSPQAAMGTWQCESCSTKSGRGFEATFEMLPRLKKIQFESGIIDKLLFLERPRECRLFSGLMMLEFGEAVHETVFHQFRVVREGKLRIIITRGLKIQSWEFCSTDHEELLPRSLIASQVNEFVHAAQNCQTTIDGNGSDITTRSRRKLQYLENNLDLQLVGELGFSKRYIRFLQIADVFNSMEDLMTFSWETKIGPIDEFQDKEKLEISQGMPTGTVFLSSSSALSSNENYNSNMSKDGLLTTSEKAALAHLGDYCKLLRQTSINSNVSKSGESSYLYKRNIQDHMIQRLLQMVSNSRAVNWADKESVDHIINDVLAGLPTNANDTGSFGNVVTFENSTSIETISENAFKWHCDKEQWR
ncbi:hypothetical protein P3X46_029973 [Hevea brasiliensis]|uniref:Uncharacterized protein n=1 Tax=Hevea brasiliensis TaxID=3981 RepID=A0ABQ9KXC1_HEVBR|nr:hypothetical protein P3X46_029973 [Hevea brasiliensis]